MCRALATATTLTPDSMQAARDVTSKTKSNTADQNVDSTEPQDSHEAAEQDLYQHPWIGSEQYNAAAAARSGVATAMAVVATGPQAVPRAALLPSLPPLRGGQQQRAHYPQGPFVNPGPPPPSLPPTSKNALEVKHDRDNSPKPLSRL